jgi:hypothetical protein
MSIYAVCIFPLAATDTLALHNHFLCRIVANFLFLLMHGNHQGGVCIGGRMVTNRWFSFTTEIAY